MIIIIIEWIVICIMQRVYDELKYGLMKILLVVISNGDCYWGTEQEVSAVIIISGCGHCYYPNRYGSVINYILSVGITTSLV